MQHLLKTKQKFSFTLQQQTYMQNNIISHCLHFGAVNVRGKERIYIVNCGMVRCMKGVDFKKLRKCIIDMQTLAMGGSYSVPVSAIKSIDDPV